MSSNMSSFIISRIESSLHWKVLDQSLVNKVRVNGNVSCGSISHSLQGLTASFTDCAIFTDDELIHLRLNIVDLRFVRMLDI